MYEKQIYRDATSAPMTATSPRDYANAVESPRDTPRLFQQCEQMEKMLCSISEHLRRIEQAANRLTNPKPQAIEKGQPENVKAHSVEHTYAMLIGQAERINLRASEIAAHLDSAV